MNKLMKGIAASDGYAISNVLILKESEIKINLNKVENTKEEIEKFENAILNTLNDLEKIKQITYKKLGQDKADIFDAHKDIANDPAIKDEIIDLITNQFDNAACATNQIMNKYFNMFNEMEDSYFKERSTDIKDVYTRVIKHILGIKIIDLSSINKEVILVSDDLTPSQTSQLDRKFVKGILTNIGGRTSHAAIMARSLEIPAILGLKTITEDLNDNEIVILDAIKGEVIISPDKDTISKYNLISSNYEKYKKELLKFKDLDSLTKDNVKKHIESNIGSVNDIEGVIENGADGVGLFRSEFLYMDNDHFPTEEEQFVAYKKVAESLNNKLVIIRTLDIGGDKKLSYYKFDEEMNPFLGHRAIRFTLTRKDIFKDQIRALLRASAFGKIGIMFPMIATIEEFLEAKEFVEECKKDLSNENISFDKDVQVGMMIEIPAAAVSAENFAKYSDFFSIGTNDLIQYSVAVDRMNQNVAYLYQPLNPSLLKLINMTIKGAHKYNKPVGMCGEMAGDIYAMPLLLGMGLDNFSMSSTSVLKARSLMSKINVSDAEKLAKEALTLDTSEEVLNLVKEFLNKNKIEV